MFFSKNNVKTCNVVLKILAKKIKKQAGTELCQAQVKLEDVDEDEVKVSS